MPIPAPVVTVPDVELVEEIEDALSTKCEVLVAADGTLCGRNAAWFCRCRFCPLTWFCCADHRQLFHAASIARAVMVCIGCHAAAHNVDDIIEFLPIGPR